MAVVEESIAARIRRLREERGWSKYRLAMLSGIREAYIGHLETGKVGHPRADTLAAIARALDVEPSVFFGGDERRSPEAALSDLEVSIKAYIPVYGEVSAGGGMEPIDYVACTRSKPAPDTMRAFRVKGLCLEPDIHEGDTLIVDSALAPRNGDLVVIIMDGQASVKRYREKPADRVSEPESTYEGKYPDNMERWLENNGGIYRPEDAHLVGVVTEFNRKRR